MSCHSWTWKTTPKFRVLPILCSPKTTFNISRDFVEFFPSQNKNFMQICRSSKSAIF
jgi:hypothetical protein